MTSSHSLIRTAGAMVIAIAMAGGMAGPAYAHHSFGMFDMQKTITVVGTVKDFQWTNPHVWLDMVAVDPVRKQPVAWSIEADAIAIMKRKGWSHDALKPGDKVKITAHPLKTGVIGGSLVSATVNGTTFGGEYHP